ncbi:MAG: carbohydrate binding domain-containing protein, partial [Armatimonadota bacterium]|nr:carbohydrate binding domain-containing protein [Armatimonadota bacterium]
MIGDIHATVYSIHPHKVPMKTPIIITAVLLFLSAGPALAADPFPFVIPWDDATPSMTDVSFLNDGPAGSHGFIVATNGHFAESIGGKRVRFFAVNMAASSAFPTHEDAEKVAGRLAKYGVNLVRLHHMDNNWNQRESLIDFAFKDHQHLNPQQLDRLDYLIYQLKLHGIYSNINLHVSRTFSQEDGFPASVSKIPFDFDKRVDYFDVRMRLLQKKYAHDLLTHVNPYTHTAYVNEPAVLNAEITNEDTLMGDPWTGLGTGLTDLPEPFETELQAQWNDWLGKKYDSTAALSKAWTANLPTNGTELLRPTPEPASWTLEQGATTAATIETGSQAITDSMNLLDGTEDAANWTLEKIGTDVAASMSVQDGILSADVTKIDATDWHIQFMQSGLDLQEGKHYTLSFRAKADAVRDMSLGVTLDQADWRNVGLGQPVHLTTDWQTFHLPFTATTVVPGHTRVVLSVGGHTGVVNVADLMLRADATAHPV